MRILLLSPSFFGYERSVAQAFRVAGHEVDLFDERPSNSALRRALVRVAPSLMSRQIERHYQEVGATVQGRQYDALLVIKGEVVPSWFLESFKVQNPDAVRAYYTFDSLKNSPQGLRIIDHFSHRYTFDRRDAAEQASFEYKPLFYSPEYAPSEAPREFDVSFIGTLHGDRWHFVHAVAAAVSEERRRLFFYIPAAWYFWLRKLGSSKVRHVPRSAVETKALSRDQVVDTMKRSRVVIDMQREGQYGLTMRTFEALATGAALVTSNSDISEEPFFDPSLILVVPRDDERIRADEVEAFIASQPAVGSRPAGFERHSLQSWVDQFIRVFEGATR